MMTQHAAIMQKGMAKSNNYRRHKFEETTKDGGWHWLFYLKIVATVDLVTCEPEDLMY